jgi:hypothetical protein
MHPEAADECQPTTMIASWFRRKPLKKVETIIMHWNKQCALVFIRDHEATIDIPPCTKMATTI